MVLDTLENSDLLIDLANLDPGFGDDFLSTLIEDEPCLGREFALENELPYVELVVYCEVQNRKLVHLVREYMHVLVKTYNSRDLGTIDWRFATRNDLACDDHTIPIFFYSPAFLKSSHCIDQICSSQVKAVFVVLDQEVPLAGQEFIKSAQSQVLDSSFAKNKGKIQKLGTCLESLSLHQKLKLSSQAPFHHNSQKILEAVEKVLALFTEYDSSNDTLPELPLDFKLEDNMGKLEMPLLDNEVLESFCFSASENRAQKVQSAKKAGQKRKRRKANEGNLSGDSVTIPKRQFRVKGQIYVVNNIRKKWDGRQWRRLCQYKNCDHAARGSITFCVSHNKLQQTGKASEKPGSTTLTGSTALGNLKKAVVSTADSALSANVKPEKSTVSLDLGSLAKPIATMRNLLIL